jgi:hypothetical protein
MDEAADGRDQVARRRRVGGWRIERGDVRVRVSASGEKQFPAPRTTIARTAESAAIAHKTSIIASGTRAGIA